MKLHHIKCGSPVTIASTKLVVRILDITLNEEDGLEPILIDIISERGGKSICTCPKCKEEDISQEELGIMCVKCGHIVSITAVYTLKPDWCILCEDCYKILCSKMGVLPSEMPVVQPIKFKFK
jgi:hypothetical protein